MNRQLIIDRILALDGLPTLSIVSQQLLEKLEDPLAGARDYAKIINYDPAITANILKMANSVYYCPSGSKINSVQDAITMIGLDELKHIALTLGIVKDLFKNKPTHLDYQLLWKHCIAVAITTKVIITLAHQKTTNFDLFFLAGLLHDIGFFIISCLFPNEFEQFMQLLKMRQQPCYLVEQEFFGITHMEVGSLLTQAWKLNEQVSVAIMHRHFADIQNEAKLLYQTVHLADWVCTNRGYGIALLENASFSNVVWYALGLKVEDIPNIIVSTDQESAKSELFNQL